MRLHCRIPASIGGWVLLLILFLFLTTWGGSWIFLATVRSFPAQSCYQHAEVVKDCDGWDGILFAVQSVTTTGYGNYNDLFIAKESLRELAVGLMIFGTVGWSFLIATAFKWIEKTLPR